MKLTGLIVLLLSIGYSPLLAQYYFTGEVKDLHGDKLQRVAIIVQSTGLVYETGRYGDFEIISRKTDDSLTFAYNGYERYTTAIKSTDFLQVTLKELTPPSASRKNQLTSLICGIGGAPYLLQPADNSQEVVENPYIDAPATISFPANPNGIAYNNIQRFLNMGVTVPPEAVKIEEMLGYFNFNYEEPDAAELFHCSSDLVTCPWDKTHQLLSLNISARRGNIKTLPPCHLVFAIDASGSMDMPNKLPLVKAGMRLLVRNLRDIDTVSFIQYGANLSVLAGIPGSRKGDIIKAIEMLNPDGASPGEAALKLAYRVAQKLYIRNGANRVILITDGDICNDKTAAADLEDLVAQESEAGITLSCIGVGLSEGENSELPALAAKGKGAFACMEDEQEGEKLLLKQLDESLLSVADSVLVTADFDSSIVGGFRLIGYDNKRSQLTDTSLRLIGSTISSAHSMTALFEIIPRKDLLGVDKIAKMKIAYSLPGKRANRSIYYDCPNSPVPFDRADVSLKKAACIALAGMKLKGSAYAGDMAWADIEKMARKVFGSNYIDKEFINLVVKARSIYEHK